MLKSLVYNFVHTSVSNSLHSKLVPSPSAVITDVIPRKFCRLRRLCPLALGLRIGFENKQSQEDQRYYEPMRIICSASKLLVSFEIIFSVQMGCLTN